MSYRLFESTPAPVVTAPAPTVQVSQEQLFDQLDNHMKAMDSVSHVYYSVADESLTLVDKKNAVLFNEYMGLLYRNFGVQPRMVNHSALEEMHVVAVNHELSLEGWMKDLWAKIKAFFAKIGETIKEFLKRNFTRVGRLKERLKNIQTVSKEVKKGPKQLNLEKVPGGLVSKFKGFDSINESVVSKCVGTASELVGKAQDISGAAITASSNGILDGDFVAEIKRLKEVALSANSQIDKNNDERKKLGFWKDRKQRSELKEDNKSLSQVAQDAKNQSDEMDKTVTGAADSSESDEQLQAKGQESFKNFMNTVYGIMDKTKGIHLVGGKTVSKVTLTDNNELEVEFDEKASDKEPGDVTLTNSEGTARLSTEALKLIEVSEKQMDQYAKANDTILKNLNKIDNLIVDIDRVDPARYGPYRKRLDNLVRTRLNMMRMVFRSFNQVSRSFTENALNTGDAVVDYCVISMKNFA